MPPAEPTPAPGAVEAPLARFQGKLRELFQLDMADLDFGIYRLFRLKASEVNAFIDRDLPKLIDDAFKGVASSDRALAEARFAAARKRVLSEIDDDAILPTGDLVQGVRDTKAKVVQEVVQEYERALKDVRAHEATDAHKVEAFNHLYSFFSRYYDEGDFIPRRRSGANEDYTVPYRGEETLFYWPTRGMHYVKTGEHFRDYSVAIDGVLGGPYTLRFRLAEASVSKDNSKGDTRYFFPRPEEIKAGPEKTVIEIPFHYRLPTAQEAAKYGSKNGFQENLLTEALPAIAQGVGKFAKFLEAVLMESAGEGQPPYLLKRLLHFTRRQTTDYFVFPALRAFLDRELEFYLKDVVLSLDDVQGDLPGKLRTIRVIREVAGRIIEFLDQIEQVQARLFRKRRLVLRTDWLVPVRFVPSALIPKVLKCKEQIAAWTDLFGTPKKVDKAFIETHPTLVLDTRHFEAEFVRGLLEGLHDTLGDLSEATDGLLVHAENFGALRTLEPLLRERVKLIYIDPPYNTGNDGFIYKDRYQHASWATMINERLALARRVMGHDAACFVSIDDREVSVLREVMETTFGRNAALATFIWRKVDSPNDNKVAVTPDHEYVVSFSRDGAGEVFRAKSDPSIIEAYGQIAEDGRRFRDRLVKKNGRNSLRTDRPKSWFAIPAPDGTEAWPIHDDGRDGCWALGAKEVTKRLGLAPGHDDAFVWKRRTVAGTEQWVPYTREFAPTDPTRPWYTIWSDLHTMRQAQAELRSLGLLGAGFDTPKPTQLPARMLSILRPQAGWCLDFFAGSGTTAHAVVDSVRAGGAAMRFAMVEVGQHFDTVLVPRVVKVMYSNAWKDGKVDPEPRFEPSLLKGKAALPDWVNRSPRLVKVLRLESYEDSLQNLAASAERDPDRAGAIRALVGDERFRLQYLFRLPLDASDTLLNVERLESPFRYAIEIPTDTGPAERPVDLVESANLLLGIEVARYERWTEKAPAQYLAVHGRMGKDRCLILWRDLAGVDPDREREYLLSRIEALDPRPSRVLINGGSATPGVDCLDAELLAALEA